MRKLTDKQIVRNDCGFCECFVLPNKCKQKQCLFYEEPTKRQIQRATTVFVSVKHKENKINKSMVYALYDSGFSMAEVAEKLNLRPQKVVDIIEERRKRDVLQNV